MFNVTLATIATTISSLATEVNLKRIGTYHASSKLKKHHNISTPLTDLSLGVLTFFVLHMEQKSVEFITKFFRVLYLNHVGEKENYNVIYSAFTLIMPICRGNI